MKKTENKQINTLTDSQLQSFGIRQPFLVLNQDIFRKNKEEKKLLKKIKKEYNKSIRIIK